MTIATNDTAVDTHLDFTIEIDRATSTVKGIMAIGVILTFSSHSATVHPHVGHAGLVVPEQGATKVAI